MSKAENFIKEHTRNTYNYNSYAQDPIPWLTPDQARRAVEIARGETLQEVKSKLLFMLNTSVDNKHFFEQLDDYIEELQTSNER